MSVSSGMLRCSRALLAAARSGTPLSKPSISTSTSKMSAVVEAVAPKSPKKKKVSSGTSGIMKATPISVTLQSFVGAEEASRVDAVKKVWEYIKVNNLQNPTDKREIFCDAKLKKLFAGMDKVGFLEVAKLLSPHFLKTN